MEQQETLDLKVDRKITSVEEYKFDPIRGRAMLHWVGKRPFYSTQFYPAQLKESHGTELNGWMNKIFWGDNLQVASHLLKEFRGKVNLIYIDPPFDSNADYKKKIALKGKTVQNDITVFEEKQYTDIWNNDEYLQFMYERFILLRELLSEKGTIWVHCDWRKSHHLRCVLEEVFGYFVNQIIWQKTRVSKGQSLNFGNVHDIILVYSKSPSYDVKPVYLSHSESYIKSHYNLVDENNRKYGLWDFTQAGSGPARSFGDQIIAPPAGKHWIWSQEKIDDGMAKNLIEFTSNGMPRLRRYLDQSKGKRIGDIWDDVFDVNSQAKERLDYPTQKPEALIERVINSGSNPGDIVFDCFMGSGTTQAVAMKLGRRFIGADINLGAIQTTTKRLLSVAKELQSNQPELEFGVTSMAAEPTVMYGSANQQANQAYFTGFEVFNVNHYDVFRNPVEAKDLLVKALEIQPLPNNALYDGEKDGRMVKIMPINRIATRADLNELITGFDYKTFDKRNDDNPGKPVESLLLVCMGHEPDLAAYLRSEVPYKLDVEVVDILRDKSNLEFKRDAEAEVTIEGGKLLIREFYPMNLLQKLSLMKENVEDWRELTESVMIDYNYDGAVFSPSKVDVPGKNELVSGVYLIPGDAGVIRVKITDLLSESLEVTVNG
ncbi:site-specific DNA-methyltransferase [uncultured Pontibacter sp.]|uniref:site-specific DNA-methyltransferase n=1 Tax=uncultured Pontibacter sp. TaxID=453356 RepID=UPI00262ECF38|nr:site-specific DNA-methyltransferase [uncultured Pontibacter sp.]